MNRHSIHRRFARLSVIALSAVAITSVSSGQMPSPRLDIRKSAGSLFLDYYPGFTSAGATMLHFSDDLQDLGGKTPASLFDVSAATPGPLTLDVSAYQAGPRGFFKITEFPGLTVADFAPNDDDPIITEIPPLYNVETLTAIPSPLTTSTALPVNIRLRDGTSNAPLTLDGSVQLELRTAGGAPVGFAYTISPDTLPMTAGVVNGSVTLSTAGSLAGVYLAVADVTITTPAIAGLRKANVSSLAAKVGNGIIGETPKVLADYQNTAAGWHHPLGAVKQLAGSFGEWRFGATGTSGQPHFGMDLAAASATTVFPVKRGVVSRIAAAGPGIGQYMVVAHGDGYASVYMHVDPIAQVHQIVETGTPICKVAAINGPHLHLQLSSNFNPGASAGAYVVLSLSDLASRSQGFDPGVVNAAFDIPLIQSGTNDLSTPQIKALYISGKDPKTTNFAPAGPGGSALQIGPNEAGRFLVAQIVDKENPASLTSGYITPSHFDFAVEDPITRALTVRDSFDYDTEGEARKLFQDHTSSFPNFGYVRRVGNALPIPAMYQYWFRWDTTAGLTNYSGQKLGPRQVRLSASDRAGHSVTQTFSFGPQLTPPPAFTGDPSTVNGSTFDLQVRSFMGPFPSGMSGTPQDSITLTLANQGLTTSWEASFTENSQTTLLKTLAGHADASLQTVTVRVKLKNGSPPPSGTENLLLSARSTVFPGLWHEITVGIAPDSTPVGMALIPAGSFSMGNALSASGDGRTGELPVHTVYVSAFYMDRYEVTKALWDEVRAWGLTHGYTDLPAGSGKAATHPVQSVTWYAMVKWCNARSEKEGLTAVYCTNDAQTTLYKTGNVNVTNAQVKWSANGYRLPTEAEWEKAARGGAGGHRFPWADVETITHAQANYSSSAIYSYDVSPTRGYHPTYAVNGFPYTSPVGSFAPNGYGLYDIAGNVWEWCWDWRSDTWYSQSGATANDPQGPPPGSSRVLRGGGWNNNADYCRTADRSINFPADSSYYFGFRSVRR